MAAYRRAVYAPTTKQVYSLQLRAYLRFCLAFNYAPVPASAKTLCRYAVFLVRTLSPSSIEPHLNCVRIFHVENGFCNPLKDNWPLQLVLRDITKCLGQPPRQKLPITPQILHTIYSQVDLSHPLHIVLWAARLVGFYSFCRKATLVSSSKGRYRDALCRRNIQFTAKGVIIHVRKTRTLQCRQRVLDIPLAEQPNSPLCPVAALKDVWGLSAPPPDQPLFTYMLSDGWHCSGYKTFTSLLSDVIQRCGLNTSLYSGHNLRRGGATYAFKCGVPPAYIKAQGD